MRVGTYRNESRSRHFDLTGRRGRRWSIDLVAATASCILLEGFACSLVAVCVHYRLDFWRRFLISARGCALIIAAAQGPLAIWDEQALRA
jgi:hypothetical protein